MKSNIVDFQGILRFDEVNIHINEYGKRIVDTVTYSYEKNEPFNIEAEMEIDRKKYEAMRWYNKTFCNEGNK